MEQAWKGERLGKFTSSEIGKLMVKGRSKEQYFGDGAITYIESRAAEIFNQLPVTNLDGMKAVEWGKQYEAEAVVTLEQKLGVQVEYYGAQNPKLFSFEPLKQWAGGSPDGIIPSLKAVFDIKCPENSTNHIKYWRMKSGADLKSENQLYYAQLQFNMLCTGLRKSFFVSYDPRPLESAVRLKILEVTYDEPYCLELVERLHKAVDMLRQIIFTDVLGQPSIALASHDPEVNATIVEEMPI